MKKTFLFTLTLMIAFSTFAERVIKGNTNTFLKEYELTQINEHLYELSYSNCTEKFTIEVCPEEKQCCYLLRNKQIEVMYLCDNLGFGLRKMPDKKQNISTGIYCNSLNYKSFKNQSLLTPNHKKTIEALGIIACFFPEVVNFESRDLVFTPSVKKEKNPLTSIN